MALFISHITAASYNSVVCSVLACRQARVETAEAEELAAQQAEEGAWQEDNANIDEAAAGGCELGCELWCQPRRALRGAAGVAVNPRARCAHIH